MSTDPSRTKVQLSATKDDMEDVEELKLPDIAGLRNPPRAAEPESMEDPDEPPPPPAPNWAPPVVVETVTEDDDSTEPPAMPAPPAEPPPEPRTILPGI